jgi:uncharacterized protein DUF1570
MNTLRVDLPRRLRATVALALALILNLVPSPRAASANPPDDGLPPDTAAARATLVQLGPRFGAHYTPHFTLLSDADPDRIELLGGLAEETWSRVHRFTERLRLGNRPATKKLLVIYFDSWEGYDHFLRPGGFVISPNIPGFFDQLSNRCIMFNSAAGPLIRDKRRELASSSAGAASTTLPAALEQAHRQVSNHERIINETVFRHELTHLVLFNIGVQTPLMHDRRWLQEGLAMQFESASVVNPYRAADFLALDPRPLAPGVETSAEAYAVAWALVFYLTTEQSEPFALYLTTPRLPRDKELRAFEEHFGPIDAAFVERCRRTIAAARAAR